MEFLEILYGSFVLILSFDYELYQIIFLSLRTSLLATFFGSIIGILTAYILVIYQFRLKNMIIISFASLMGVPPVVVGLIVYYLFSQSGPLGLFSILFTPYVMIIAQIIIVYPIVSSLTRELFQDFWDNYKQQFRSQNIPMLAIVYTFLKNTYGLIITVLLSAFGRAISEVGAVMIVGGNIEHYTRVMTTAISLETSIGNLQKAMSLGIILIIITMIINGLMFKLKRKNGIN